MRWSSLDRRTLPVILVLFAFACGEEAIDGPTPHTRVRTAAAPPPPAAAPVPGPPRELRIAFLPSMMIVGVSVHPLASLDGHIGPLATQWTSSDPSVVQLFEVSAGVTFARALRPGVAVIAAAGGGVTAQRAVTVLAAPVGVTPIEETDLRVPRFALLDLGGDPSWEFTPAIEVQSRTGGPLVVLGFTMSVPGVSPLQWCWTRREFGGDPMPLIRESYGDWDLSFSTTRARYTGGPIGLTLIVREPLGRVVRVEVAGAMEPGAYPSSYSGGTIAETWACG